ncbi:MAG: peptidase S58 family protein [Actinobacteria bacterium]|nr:peptidase S58 family protein [Actinomycetota bacterium]
MTHSICDVPGIKVGHAQDDLAKTGCTVVLPDVEATAGVDVRGSAPGTREIELLKPVRLVQKVHGILLAGGSAFGLNAAGGVQRFLEERGIGFQTRTAVIPLVPAAVIYDLDVGDPGVRPDAGMGYNACLAARADEHRKGVVGVGCGATVGKIAGQEKASPGGIGTCSLELTGGIVVGVLTVVNALGEIVDPVTGNILAGLCDDKGTGFYPSVEAMKNIFFKSPFQSMNTTLTVVATNAGLTREQATKVAQMAQDGFARVIRPAHTMYDGDIVFALSVGELEADVNLIGAVACELVAESIVRAVKAGKE